MIRVLRQRSFGDAAFVYAFGMVESVRWGYRLCGRPPAGFVSDSVQRRNGEIEVYSPVAQWGGHWPFDCFFGRRLQSSEIREAPGEQLLLGGPFHRFDLIADFRDEIRYHWLKPVVQMPGRPSSDFVVCLRTPELPPRMHSTLRAGWQALNQENTLSADNIRHLAHRIPHRRLFIVTDSAANPVLRQLRDLAFELVPWQGFKTVLFIRSFQKIAIDQNVSQWWAAFLSDAREVYFPPCETGLWSHPEPANHAFDPWHYGVDLRVDEDRYVYDWWK